MVTGRNAVLFWVEIRIQVTDLRAAMSAHARVCDEGGGSQQLLCGAGQRQITAACKVGKVEKCLCNRALIACSQPVLCATSVAGLEQMLDPGGSGGGSFPGWALVQSDSFGSLCIFCTLFTFVCLESCCVFCCIFEFVNQPSCLSFYENVRSSCLIAPACLNHTQDLCRPKA